MKITPDAALRIEVAKAVFAASASIPGDTRTQKDAAYDAWAAADAFMSTMPQSLKSELIVAGNHHTLYAGATPVWIVNDPLVTEELRK